MLSLTFYFLSTLTDFLYEFFVFYLFLFFLFLCFFLDGLLQFFEVFFMLHLHFFLLFSHFSQKAFNLFRLLSLLIPIPSLSELHESLIHFLTLILPFAISLIFSLKFIKIISHFHNLPYQLLFHFLQFFSLVNNLNLIFIIFDSINYFILPTYNHLSNLISILTM